MNSEKRPRGRNCYGIFPEQCGADKAAQFIARSATPELREQIAGLSPGGDVRFIGPGDAVIADLRLDRLNVHLTDAGRITSVDCY